MVKGLVIFAALACGVQAATASEIVGIVTHVTDGDTFTVASTPIRTCGIDTPEKGIVGYAEAKIALRKLIEGKAVRCVPVNDGTVCDGRSRRKNQGRIVAQCFIGEIDIAEVMVRAGLACDWVSFPPVTTREAAEKSVRGDRCLCKFSSDPALSAAKRPHLPQVRRIAEAHMAHPHYGSAIPLRPIPERCQCQIGVTAKMTPTPPIGVTSPPFLGGDTDTNGRDRKNRKLARTDIPLLSIGMPVAAPHLTVDAIKAPARPLLPHVGVHAMMAKKNMAFDSVKISSSEPRNFLFKKAACRPSHGGCRNIAEVDLRLGRLPRREPLDPQRSSRQSNSFWFSARRPASARICRRPRPAGATEPTPFNVGSTV